MKRLILMAVAVAAAVAHAHQSSAAIIYSTVASTYSQNFDSLPNTPTNTSLGSSPAGWTDDNSSPPAGNFSIPGFYLHHPLTQTEGGANGNQRMRLGNGSANTGGFWSYGAAASTDRAFGTVSSNTAAAVGAEQFLGMRLTNTTGLHLASFTIGFTGEQWRDGGASAGPPDLRNAQSLTFDWSTNATALQTGVYTDVPALTFTSPVFVNTGSGAAVDGNAAANRTVFAPLTVNNINWQPGTDLWIRWSDVNNAGNDHGFGIDDVTFSAEIPEPASFALVILGAIGLVAARRVR
jgi:hypothetical protein